jgi:alpha-L-fucosidase
MKKPGTLISFLLIPLLIIAQEKHNDSISAVNKFESSLRQKLEKADKPNLAGRYKANFKSLEQYEIPQWYEDAKFGIFIHWGIFSVPAINDCWYGYWMYREKEDLPDFLKTHPYTATRAFHLKYYGPTDKFGYKDLIPLFTAKYFNANDWVTLFKKAGAKYIVPVAEFHDLFPMYDCSLTDWNAVKMGPKRDVVGEIRQATLANGLKFGVSSHRVFHQDESYYLHNGKNDADNPEYWGLYWKPFKNPKVEDPLFIEETLYRTVELANKYQPDLLWFDAGTSKPQFRDFCQTIAAHFYNQAETWKKPGVVLNYKWNSFPEGTAVLDLEASKMDSVHYPFWQTDMSMSETWSYSSDGKYKTAEQLIHTLIDIVSKNGTLLLNISPLADGRIPMEEQDRLLEMGAWLQVNGEAIYGTRPFKNYGEGPTKSNSEMVQQFTSRDIRYTTKGKTLYAIVMDWPGEKVNLTLPVFRQQSNEAKVTLLGYNKPLVYTIEKNKISIEFPVLYPFQRSCKYAYVMKFEGFEIE